MQPALSSDLIMVLQPPSISTLINTRLLRVLRYLQLAFRSPYYGFIEGHSYLDSDQITKIRRLVGRNDEALVLEFEQQFQNLVGLGEAVSYASARMGFFELMRLLEIGPGDEVILLGSTCAVMVNAVIRVGATPVFSDIDNATFGSSCKSIEACITSYTRMIVAQHSFGIPCDIQPIVKLAKANNIFLLEDCALTLGSKVEDTVVGNFGDAALFSTDHSKPLNTLTGGLIYTLNSTLARNLRLSRSNVPDFSIDRQHSLFNRLLLEAFYSSPSRYGRIGLVEIFTSLWKKVTREEGDLLINDSGILAHDHYPYPARLPAFLAAIGLLECQRWKQVSINRKNSFRRIYEAISTTKHGPFLPEAYRNDELDIVPLRFVWSEPNAPYFRNLIRNFIHVEWTWFMSPIIATNEPLHNFGYCSGACPMSEYLGPNMVNIPCTIDQHDVDLLLSLLRKVNY